MSTVASPTDARPRPRWRGLRPRRRIAIALAQARSAWRRSLRLRVLAVTTVVGIVALALVSAYLSDRVRDALYDQRVAEALADASSRTAQIQAQLDAATATTPAQVQSVAFEIVRAAQSPGSGAIGTMLRRSPSDTGISPIDFSVGSPVALSEDLRSAVQDSTTQQWQAVTVDTADGTGPGVVVGARVFPPEVGAYELYFVYSLIPEQSTLTLIQQTLALAAFALLGLLAAMALYLTRQVLGPVQQAARTAERLAAGHLDERMTEHGRDELALLGRSFNEMAESLQDQIERLAGLSRVQQQFVSDVSHELRTPLTTIRMASELLYDARGDFDATTRRSAELLHAQVDRFEALLADLLEISRFDAGAAVLDVEHLDVRTVVRRAVDLAAPLAERMGTSFVLEEPGQACRADLDPRRVERVLRNLLANAIEHAEGRPIEVVVAADDRAVAVSVVDHGVGMTARQTEQVFDRFWRGDPSRARTIGGTGLGLAISLEDARLHGGRLEAWGRPGVGASFRLTLPRRAGVVVTSSPGPLERTTADPEPTRVSTGPSPAALPELGETREVGP
ncbi:MAG TPA: two-component sensor histidine kinase [Micrococcales bacterium]|uniref:Sensor histidine kinase MtrB n=1 Tax=Miniimonas arenae TaxID=676201 RepID=A0A5C5BDA8_9MICO|nr:MtrAB system histidine kinase MtrB [Miniimonas arenae]TNU75939.1 HAMP domain-containing histidine kinase [Miniimonas arenae]HCX84550.1 two-component sensor histidine kinase [Micrococcales bacterium]